MHHRILLSKGKLIIQTMPCEGGKEEDGSYRSCIWCEEEDDYCLIENVRAYEYSIKTMEFEEAENPEVLITLKTLQQSDILAEYAEENKEFYQCGVCYRLFPIKGRLYIHNQFGRICRMCENLAPECITKVSEKAIRDKEYYQKRRE